MTTKDSVQNVKEITLVYDALRRRKTSLK